MKKVITTVGTSIFQNYKEKTEQKFGELNESYLFNKPYSEDDERNNSQIKEIIRKWLKSGENLNGISAEIKSLTKLQEERKEELEVYLITTDTVASNLAAEIIKEYLDKKQGFDVKKIQKIDSLQVKDRSLFVKEGFPNLINSINSISNGYFDNLIMNITGGYKGIIPFLTIFSSINNVELVYIYEESSEMISIPILPIVIDYEFIENHSLYLAKLECGIDDYTNVKNNNYKNYDILEKKGFIENIDNMAMLSPVGQIFYDRFKKNHFSFFCLDEVWKDIQKQKDIQRILKTKFPEESLRNSKLESKQVHFVFDDGNNNNRIYYFLNKEDIYIYKTFENEEKAKAYIGQSIDRNKIIKESKIRTITLEEK